MTLATASLAPLDYVVFAFCLTISAGIGVFYRFVGGRQSTTEEFLMADRQMSVFPVALSLLASFISAITLLGTPTEIYLYGTQYVLLAIGNIIVIPISAYLYIPVLFRLRLTSAYEYLDLRFNKATRTLATVVYASMMIFYLGIVLYSPCLALSSLTGLNLWMLIGIAGVICIFYTTLGGMKAVMWTDAFQVSIMFLGIFVVVILGSARFVGGFNGAWDVAARRGRIEFDNFSPTLFERHTVWGTIVGGTFTWLAIYAVNQAQVQRCLTCPSLRHARLALAFNAPGLFLFVILSSCVGVLVFARYADCDPLTAGVLDAKDQLLPLFVMETLSAGHPGLAGLFVSCVFCGSLSTISSGLNSLAAVVLQDIVRVYICNDLSDSAATLISKCLVLGFGVTCIALTWVASQMGGVLSAALSLFGAVGGPLLGLFTLGIFIPFANATGAIVGTVSALSLSTLMVIGSQMFPPPVTTHCWSTTKCFLFQDSFALNLSSVPWVECDQVTFPITGEGYKGLSLYRISYIWYSIISVIIVVIVGVIVTILNGRRHWAKPSPELVSPLLYRFVKGNEVENVKSSDFGSAEGRNPTCSVEGSAERGAQSGYGANVETGVSSSAV